MTPSAYGLGEGIIANRSYDTVATVNAGNGYPMDIHEFELTDSGDALFTIYSPILVHLPGDPEGELSPLLDAIVQQVDVRTGLVVWEWHSYGHIPLSESQATPENSASYDAFHINSIQPLAHDKVLISARDTSALYKVDRSSGRIVWRLGGSASDFKLGKGARFHFQHDARWLGDGQLSLFDDQAGPPQFAPSSRGLILKLKRHPKRATVVKSYHRPEDTSAQSEGVGPDPPRRRALRRLGRAAVLQPVLAARQAALRRPAAGRRRLLPRLPRALEGESADAAGRGGGPRRRLERLGLRELERGDRGRALAAARRRRRVLAGAGRDRRPPGLRDPDRRRQRREPVRRPGARRRRQDARDLGAGRRAVTPKPPNLLLLITDQQRAPRHWPEDPGWLAELTPNDAELARTGLSFKNAFCNTAMCSPSRATLLTGRYPAEHGVTLTLTTGDLQPDPRHTPAVVVDDGRPAAPPPGAAPAGC